MALPFGYGEFDIAACLPRAPPRSPPRAGGVRARACDSPRRAACSSRTSSGRSTRCGAWRWTDSSGCAEPRHQRLLPDADIRGYLDANDLVLTDVRGEREQRSTSSSASTSRACPRRSGRRSAARRRLRPTRSRSAGTSRASRDRRSSLVAVRRRPRRDPATSPGRSACAIETGGKGTRATVTSPLFLLDCADDRLRDVVGLDHEVAEESAAELRALREALRLDEAGQDRVHAGSCSSGAAPPSSGRTRAGRASPLRTRRPDAKATVPETETTFTTWAPPSAAATRSPGSNARRHQTPPR